MQAIKFSQNKISMVTVPEPQLDPEEVLVRVIRAGICNTDIELYAGYYEFEGIPGHEFVGIVEKAPGNEHLLGKRLVADINIGCGECFLCRSGNTRHCPDRSVLGIQGWDGVFAEFIKLPVKNVHIVPPEVETNSAVFAEPLAASLEVAHQIHLTHQNRTAILGDGKLGLLLALSLQLDTVDLYLLGKHYNKLKVAENHGIKTLNVTKVDISSLGYFDVVIEATGRENGVQMAMDMVRPEGTVVIKTTSHKPSLIDMAKIVVDEIRVIGSRCGDIRTALNFIEKDIIDFPQLVEAEYSFGEFSKAFEHAKHSQSKKIILCYN